MLQIKMKFRGIFAVLGLLFAIIQFSPPLAFAEECPVIDFAKLNFGNPPPTTRWKKSDPVRVITWSSNATMIGPDQVLTPFSSMEQAWLQQAFDNYGEILDSIAFQKVESQADANIIVGYTKLSGGVIPTNGSGGNFGLWDFDPRLDVSGLRLLDPTLWPTNFPLFKSEPTFILPVENEIGNILGVPDVNRNGPVQSLVSIYDTSKLSAYGQLKINDYDAAIMRQLYSESTCSSKYSNDARAKNLVADKIAGIQYLAKMGIPVPTSSSPAKAKSMICSKKNSVKKVSGISPMCPAGYKKK